MPPRRTKSKVTKESRKLSKYDSFTDLYDGIYHTKLTNFSTTEFRS